MAANLELPLHSQSWTPTRQQNNDDYMYSIYSMERVQPCVEVSCGSPTRPSNGEHQDDNEREGQASAQRALEEYHQQLRLLEEQNRRQRRLARNQRRQRQRRGKQDSTASAPRQSSSASSDAEVNTLADYQQRLLREAQRRTQELQVDDGPSQSRTAEQNQRPWTRRTSHIQSSPT